MSLNLQMILTGLIVLVVIAAVVALEYYLATRESRVPGLVLPILCMVYSVLMMVQVTIYSFDSIFEVFLQMITSFFVANIPTLVLVVVYAACRCKVENEEDEEDAAVVTETETGVEAAQAKPTTDAASEEAAADKN